MLPKAPLLGRLLEGGVYKIFLSLRGSFIGGRLLKEGALIRGFKVYETLALKGS